MYTEYQSTTFELQKKLLNSPNTFYTPVLFSSERMYTEYQSTPFELQKKTTKFP